MGEHRIIVDHLKLEYKGPVNFNELIRNIETHFAEKHFEKRSDRTYEIDAPKGKYIEWIQGSWKKISDWIRLVIKIRIQAYDMVKVDAVLDKKKIRIDNCRMIIYFDGYIETDYEHRWDEKPLLIFFRTIKDKFLEKAYTERFESILTQDVHQVYELTQRYLNMQRAYTVVSKPGGHFSL